MRMNRIRFVVLILGILLTLSNFFKELNSYNFGERKVEIKCKVKDLS